MILDRDLVHHWSTLATVTFLNINNGTLQIDNTSTSI